MSLPSGEVRTFDADFLPERRICTSSYPSSFRFKDNHVPAAFAPSCHIFYGERVINIDDEVRC